MLLFCFATISAFKIYRSSNTLRRVLLKESHDYCLLAGCYTNKKKNKGKLLFPTKLQYCRLTVTRGPQIAKLGPAHLVLVR